MEIEITAEQFTKIQNEIIRLEEELQSLQGSNDTWGFIFTKDRIEELKEILETETITL